MLLAFQCSFTQVCIAFTKPAYLLLCVNMLPYPLNLFDIDQPAVSIPAAVAHRLDCKLSDTMFAATHCTLCCSLANSRTRFATGADAPSPDGLRKAVKLSRFC